MFKTFQRRVSIIIVAFPFKSLAASQAENLIAPTDQSQNFEEQLWQSRPLAHLPPAGTYREVENRSFGALASTHRCFLTQQPSPVFV